MCGRACGRTRFSRPVRKAVASIDPTLALLEVHRMDEEMDASVASERLLAALASIFAGLAALIAVVGLYALLTYAVAQRHARSAYGWRWARMRWISRR